MSSHVQPKHLLVGTSSYSSCKFLCSLFGCSIGAFCQWQSSLTECLLRGFDYSLLYVQCSADSKGCVTQLSCIDRRIFVAELLGHMTCLSIEIGAKADAEKRAFGDSSRPLYLRSVTKASQRYTSYIQPLSAIWAFSPNQSLGEELSMPLGIKLYFVILKPPPPLPPLWPVCPPC